MDTVGRIVLTACLLAVGISILEMLYPEGKFQKQVKLLFSMVFIISLAGPLVSGNFEFPEFDLSSSVEYSDLQTRSDEEFISLTEKNIAETLKAKLNSQKLSVKEISVKINISDSRSISISEVKIICPENSNQEMISRTVTEEVGADTLVSITEDRRLSENGEN